MELFLKRKWKIPILSWELAHASRASAAFVSARHKRKPECMRKADTVKKSSRKRGFSRTSWMMESDREQRVSKSMPGQLLSHPTWLVYLCSLKTHLCMAGPYFISWCFLFCPPISVWVTRVGYWAPFFFFFLRDQVWNFFPRQKQRECLLRAALHEKV